MLFRLPWILIKNFLGRFLKYCYTRRNMLETSNESSLPLTCFWDKVGRSTPVGWREILYYSKTRFHLNTSTTCFWKVLVKTFFTSKTHYIVIIQSMWVILIYNKPEESCGLKLCSYYIVWEYNILYGLSG